MSFILNEILLSINVNFMQVIRSCNVTRFLSKVSNKYYIISISFRLTNFIHHINQNL